MLAVLPVVASAVLGGLLRETPMIMAHDCATGYLRPTIPTKEVYDWTITQVGEFPEQLDCGARGFDLRPATRDGKLIMHHGGVDVHKPMEEAIDDMIGWLARPNNTNELLVLIVHDCAGTNCDEMVDATLKNMNLTVLPCSDLSSLTYTQAAAQGRLPKGGSIVIFRGCNAENYDPKIGCYPPYEKPQNLTADEPQPCCYCSDKEKEKAFNAMWAYMNRTAAMEFPAEEVSQLQALWQEDVESIVIGTTLLSSLVKDEERSQINSEVLSRLRMGWWKNINFLELNNVCDKGPEIRAELLKRM
eukprot:TRINITY_DN42900_c0_g1_i1.p1 TRINITY_DN42900_c0_g1~~TRINITY_DN42900_c0_g1_i1.p1  ORF type:complete len:322 (+),score=121.43 TRINITY_DN42900_c0_g1_i1:63-968(+)